jgi:electron transfer flavoprotein alpha subunit
MKDVMVVAEVMDNEIQEITFEMVGKAKELAQEMGGSVVTVLIGNKLEDLTSSLGASDTVIYVEDEKLENFTPAYGEVLSKVIERVNPKIVMIGNTAFGTDIAGLAAAKLDIPLVTSCVNLTLRDDSIVATSMAYGGKIFVDLIAERGIFVVNRGSFSSDAGKVDGSPSVEKLSLADLGVNLEDSIEFVGYIKPEVEDVDISKAEIVVGVGRGIGDESNIELAEELAEALGGVVAGSRPVIDQGWLPRTRQVGRSGKVVTGKLYLALGISGAMEHVEGVKAKNVIAVNTDPGAPIFRISRVGAVIDVLELLPVLIDKISEAKSG